jgi:hypothetical protein
MSRDNLRRVWPMITGLTHSNISLSTCERRLVSMPLGQLHSPSTNYKNFTVASVTEVIQQVVATLAYHVLMAQLPVKGQKIREFEHTKRFSDLHREMQVASLKTANGRFLLVMLHALDTGMATKFMGKSKKSSSKTEIGCLRFIEA